MEMSRWSLKITHEAAGRQHQLRLSRRSASIPSPTPTRLA
uniref:Uncharacterized protein n=1 Tax=Arundo donax TaxID=35708 RepID=A0A0A9H3J6_ARUDO